MERRDLACGLVLDVARTEKEWQQGLSGLVPGSPFFNTFDGMLFVFDETSCWAVTADKTLIDLCAYWLDEKGTIVAWTRLPSGSSVMYTPLVPARYLIETMRPQAWNLGDTIDVGEPERLEPTGHSNAHLGKAE